MSNGKLSFRLYLAGGDVHIGEMRVVMELEMERLLPGGYQLDIINVLESPEQAEKDGVFATPTLILKSPLPERRVIGDFSSGELILRRLGLIE
jgi:circadian clock protein KaiB